MKLDIIVPTYNEENNVIPLYKEIDKNLDDINYNIIYVNDGSKDNTFGKLKELYKSHPKNVKVINFSRNFGKDAAIYAGIENSKADYSIIIDADLQQNPKYIKKMLNFLEKNSEYDAVAMVNKYEKDSFIKRITRKCFYKTISKLSNQEFKTGASDFRMFNKKVRLALLSLKENSRFTKGIFSWIGFNTYYMEYHVEKRLSGKSKFPLLKQFAYAWIGIINFSAKPLKLATVLGSIFSIISFGYLLIILMQTLIYGKDIPGYASMMCIILLLGGIQLLVLGIIGEYIAASYRETKQRPIYISKDTLGFDKNIL